MLRCQPFPFPFWTCPQCGTLSLPLPNPQSCCVLLKLPMFLPTPPAFISYSPRLLLTSAPLLHSLPLLCSGHPKEEWAPGSGPLEHFPLEELQDFLSQLFQTSVSECPLFGPLTQLSSPCSPHSPFPSPHFSSTCHICLLLECTVCINFLGI